MTTATRTRKPPAHGTTARYQGTPRTGNRPPCGCTVCVAAWTKACAAREVQRLAGIPLRVPSGPITAHVYTLLKTGMSRAQIAAAAGVSPGAVSHLSRSVSPTVNRTTAMRVLAVKGLRITRNAERLPVHGTQRRIQALYAMGHGPLAISITIGQSKSLVIGLAGGRQSETTAATFLAVRAAYESLAHQAGTSVKARYRAEREGWKDPTYWEDLGHIDDPAFDPDTAEAAQLRIEQIAEDAEFLFALGLNSTKVAERLDITRDYLTKALRETSGKQVAA